MSFPRNPLGSVIKKVVSPDLESRSISGTLYDTNIPKAGVQVLVLNTLTFEVLTGVYTNALGAFLFKDVPLSSSDYLVLSRTPEHPRPAAIDNLTRNEGDLVLEFASSGGQTSPDPVIGGRRLYLSGGQIRGLPPA